MLKKLFLIGIILLIILPFNLAWCNGTDCNTDWQFKQELTLNTEGILTSDVTNEHAILVHIDSNNTDFWDTIYYDKNSFYQIQGNKTGFENGSLESNQDLIWDLSGTFAQGTEIVHVEGNKGMGLNSGSGYLTSNIEANDYQYVWMRSENVTTYDATLHSRNSSGDLCVLGMETGHWAYWNGSFNTLSTENETPLINTYYLLKIKHDSVANTCDFWVYKNDNTLVATQLGVAEYNAGVITNGRLQEGQTGISWDAFASTDSNYDATNFPLGGIGYDAVRFTNSDDSIDLNYHFESVNTDTNDLWAWVRVPEFDAGANTSINMYYGNENAVDNQNEEGTYPNEYKVVHHFNSLLDSTLNNIDLTNNGATHNSLGIIGSSYTFNGTSDYMSMSRPITDLTDFTILNWVNVSDTSSAQIIVDNGWYDGASSNDILYFVKGTDYIELALKDNTGSEAVATPITIAYNSNQFMSATKGSGTSSVYLNNNFNNGTNTKTFISTTNWTIGKRYGTNEVYLNGDLDELIVFNYKLNNNEIQLLYNSEKDSLITFGTHKNQIMLTADFNQTIDKINANMNLFDQSTDRNATITNWNWLVDGTTTLLNNATIQNPIISPITQNTDYNICLDINGLGDDGNIYTDSICQDISSGRWYADWNIGIYDENTEGTLNGVNLNISDGINELDFTINENIYLTHDNNLSSILDSINKTTTLTFSKTGYGTRYYVFDANKFIESDLNIDFALLPTGLSTSIPLKVYKTDETTIFDNTYIEMYRPDKNDWIVGRQKTNANGEATFSLHEIDQNYYVNVNNGEFTYQPVALTILYPKDEQTLNQITENWKIDITQNMYESYLDLNTDKVIYLLPNTANPFNIKISDMNGNYFSRTYAQQYPGNPLTDSLQPFLLPTDEGLLTTITTYTRDNITLPDVTIKIYKYISGLGRTLVEQVITDAKGQALILLEINDEYEFETYYNGDFIKTYSITATSSTIYLIVDIPEEEIEDGPSGFNVVFTPISTGLTKLTLGSQEFTQTIYNYGGVTINIYSYVMQNGIILNDANKSSSATTDTTTITIPWADLNNNTEIEIRTIITTDTNTYIYKKYYQINDSFGTNYNILEGLQTHIRQDLSCEEEGICLPLLIVAIIFSILVVLYASVKVSGVGSHGASIMFAMLLSFFTYLNWVPVELTIGIVLIIAAFIINERRS